MKKIEMKIEIDLDTSYKIDYAIFMLLAARQKCRSGFGINAPDRIELAIEASREAIDIIESYPKFHTSQILENLKVCKGD